MTAIRDLIASEKPVPPDPVETREIPQAPAAAARTTHADVDRSSPANEELDPELLHAAIAASQPEPKTRKWGLKRKSRQPNPSGEAVSEKVATSSQNEGMVDQLKAKIMGYRPTPKHIAVAAVVLLVLFRPWLVLGLLFLTAFIIVGVFLILGYDGFWRQIMRLSRWYAGRHPSRSKEIHRRLDSFAMKFDAFLDRFPEGSVDGLYLPDFGDIAEAEARHDEALDRRFDKLREREV
jgi:hypothetical protein